MRRMTTDDVMGVVNLTQAIGEVIAASSPIPSGHLYANLMTLGMNLEAYHRVMSLLTEAGVVKVENNMVRWVGRDEEQGKGGTT